jgi:transposase
LKNKENLEPKDVHQLQRLLQQYPMLRTAYQCKEQLRSWYRSRGTLTQKRAQFTKLIHRLQGAEDKALSKVATTYTNWFKEITNYFRCPMTNGYTEGFNNKIKTDKRKSYGYRNFNMHRFKVLISLVLHQK